MKLIYGKLNTNLFVKPTNTHQVLDPTCCHPYNCRKGIPYTQGLRLNRICSNKKDFYRYCNDLEKWPMQRGYNEKTIRR